MTTTQAYLPDIAEAAGATFAALPFDAGTAYIRSRALECGWLRHLGQNHSTGSSTIWLRNRSVAPSTGGWRWGEHAGSLRRDRSIWPRWPVPLFLRQNGMPSVHPLTGAELRSGFQVGHVSIAALCFASPALPSYKKVSPRRPAVATSADHDKRVLRDPSRCCKRLSLSRATSRLVSTN